MGGGEVDEVSGGLGILWRRSVVHVAVTAAALSGIVTDGAAASGSMTGELSPPTIYVEHEADRSPHLIKSRHFFGCSNVFLSDGLAARAPAAV